MKSLLMLLVVAAFTIGQAQAFRCHVCESSDNCKAESTCPYSSRYCKTTINYQHLAGNLVKKECAEICTPQKTNVGHTQSEVLCCTTDLCNVKLENSAPVHTLLSRAVLTFSLTLTLVSVLTIL